MVKKRKGNTSTSISDLVPFVAAVLKEKAIADENEELRQQLTELQQQLTNAKDERLLVQITGRDGSPVHYQASLKDGRYSVDDSGGEERRMWIVGFEQKNKDTTTSDEDIILPFNNSVNELEIRLGGHIFHFMRRDFAETNQYAEDFDRNDINFAEQPQMGGVHFHNVSDSGPICFVHGRFGPVLWNDFINQTGIQISN